LIQLICGDIGGCGFFQVRYSATAAPENGCALFYLRRNALCALNSAGASLYAMKANGRMAAEFTDQGLTLYNDINYAVK